MNGFEKRAQRIKDSIKNATLELLSSMEPRAIRITDIANKADVSQVSIYNHFGSKEELIRDALKSFYFQHLEEYEKLISEGSKSFKETISFILFQKRGTIQKFSAKKLNELLLQDPEMNKFVKEIYSTKVFPLFLEMIEKAKRNGEIANDIAPSLVIFYLNMFSEKSEEMLQLSTSYSSEEQFIEDLTNLFFYGIAGRR
ncbi:TetR/AcrR family transcriptional regulator [Cytobacillus sp. IB215316]|uniref:TetR/AcrR family transcriptional regulator n=1 Tax=Cytobacillus sp. IB215316 TaxID=3097354 RepID=UPI002A125AE6|nr:TetR/AcrR family transcriptional regulator [Cytobacillus sp. IB215316]MDX8360075.1 TetR/AcrR family transcriptional regulator [Cytobacillus sp. IB215316]